MNITAKDFTEALNKNVKIRSDVIWKLTDFDIYDWALNGDELNVVLVLKDQYLKEVPNAKGTITMTIDFNIWDYVDFHQVIYEELAEGDSVKDVIPQGDYEIQQLGLDLVDFIAKN